ncbi:UPF0498 protein KIAA1191 [Heterocephalus glaber]|uniref:Putative monooxygenase p33MONOX n=1 Tax=Heterocephalus glaber TaxID=10181 RepID=G5C326_HETGA|nr:UPF0498 protein KIAA1191 [Heterocephalus glaber]
MASRQPKVPALGPSGPLGKMSLPIGMCRRAFSCDNALENPAPMTPPPADMGSIPWKPVIPEGKYQHLAKAEEGEASVSPTAVMQESIQHFEQQAGLRDAGYTPHKGLTTEETKYLRVAEALHKLKLQSGETTKKEKQPASSQSSPSSTPHSSPKQKSRGWFMSGSFTALTAPNPSTTDPGSGDKDRTSLDKWNVFGSRPLQRSDSGGLAVQAYKEAQKPSPMELICAQATRMPEDPATFKLPKMDIPVIEMKKAPLRIHNLKPHDLNVLVPTGF